MKSFAAALAVSVAALAGCAGETARPSLPLDHPANPNAVESPPPAWSNTLNMTPLTAVQSKPLISMPFQQPEHAEHAERSPREGGSHEGHGHAPPASMTSHHSQPEAGANPATTAAPPAPDADATPVPAESPQLFVCPMHPEVTSILPDQRCSKCRMPLVPKERAHEH